MSAVRGSETAHSEDDWARLEAERQRLAQALDLTERDRQLLGYEIHDHLVQDLTAAAMLLEGAAPQLTFHSSDAQESYTAGLRLLRDSIAGARQLIDSQVALADGTTDFRMLLRRLVEKFRTELALPVQFECQAEDVRLPPSVQHLLLRIAQESLFNAWKHAQASRVTLHLARISDQLTLSIADDGVGFDPNQRRAGSFGLEGIHARSAALGAKLVIDSSPGRGTRIEVTLNLPAGVSHA
jgi:signal transduction histidine kinase